jgi:hypothetical protein
VSRRDSHDDESSSLHGEFSTIESALEFFHLLRSAIADTAADVQRDVADSQRYDDRRRTEALQLVSYKLQQLDLYTGKSERLLRDLARLRSVILGESKSAVMVATDAGD